VSALALAILLWSGVVVATVLVVPWSGATVLDCMHLVGRSAACEEQQETINQGWWAVRTLPIVVTIVAGYVAIGIVRLVGLSRVQPAAVIAGR
jgi:hypothetical protein